MSYFITKLTMSNNKTRRELIKQRASWLKLTTPHLDLSDEINELKEKLPKVIYITSAILSVVRRIETDGVSLNRYKKITTLLKDIDLSVEESKMPLKPNSHSMYTNALLNDVINSEGLLAALNRLNLETPFSTIISDFKRGATVDKFINSIQVVKSAIQLLDEQVLDEDITTLLSRRLQPIFDEGDGFYGVGKLLDNLGIKQTGFIKEDIPTLASDDALKALRLMQRNIRVTLDSYFDIIRHLEQAIGDYTPKLEELTRNLKDIHNLLTTLEVLEKAISRWDGTHVQVVKELTS